MPATNVTAAAAMPISLIESSSSLGQNTRRSTPTSGRNVAIGSQKLSSLSVWMASAGMRGSSSHVDDHEHDGSDCGGAEEQRTVLVDPARLQGAQALTGPLGEKTGPVHGAVDESLVDVAVRPLPEPLAQRAGAVDDAIDE